MTSAGKSSAGRMQIAIAVVERDGRFLIGLREQDVPLAGYWEFPGGKIQPGETATEAAVRECLEETNLVVRVTGSYPSAVHGYPHAQVELHFVHCAVLEERAAIPQRFRWVSVAELPLYRFPPANDALLQILHLQQELAPDPPRAKS